MGGGCNTLPSASLIDLAAAMAACWQEGARAVLGLQWHAGCVGWNRTVSSGLLSKGSVEEVPMYAHGSADRYVHSALFANMQEAEGALQDMERVGVSSDQISLVVHEESIGTAEIKLPPHDGKQGLVIGLGCGALLGLLAALLCVQYSLLPGFLSPVFGVGSGLLFGGLGGGLAGLSLTPSVPPQPSPPPSNPTCRITATAPDVTTMIRVKRIFRKHNGIVG